MLSMKMTLVLNSFVSFLILNSLAHVQKTEVITVNMLSPLAKIICKWITNICDSRCFRQKSVELIPIMSHFFNQINRVRVKLLKVPCVEFEIFDLIVNITMNTVQKFNIEDKMICFCSHNTNTNFGKAQNHSINNCFY